MSATLDPARPQEYPPRIVDSCSGLTVVRGDHGRPTASCLAVNMHDDNAAELHVQIGEAIIGNH